MRIAVPVWDGRLSPLLDTAMMLRVYETDNTRVLSTHDYTVGNSGSRLAETIGELADVIICGALSGELETNLTSRGIRVHPWAMGGCDEVVESFLTGGIENCEYSMPGCRRGRGRGGGCVKGGGRGGGAGRGGGSGRGGGGRSGGRGCKF